MQTAWADLSALTGALPFKHDHYLKLYQLTDPLIAADFVLFDEAQDANPVIAAIVAAQEHAQLIYVGDSQQSIYGFTGAQNALAKVDADHRALLTQSFRFGPAIANEANKILARIDGAELRLKGHADTESVVGDISDPRAILTRTNAVAVNEVIAQQAIGRKPHLVGGGDQVLRFARAAEELQRGERTWHPELACFKSWEEVQAYVEDDVQGDDIALLVRLVDDFGADTITEALGRMPSEANADVTVSTAHKSKGREWSTVRLADDFVRKPKEGQEPIEPSVDELRLQYVAVTRARFALDNSSLSQ
jgi:superfamily I DNA/RNA helicase